MSQFRFSEQKAVSLRHRISDEIRQAIFEGKLKPGDRLREAEISNQMGVSRGPIREALRVLEQEGLIYSLPFKETVVAEFSTEEIVEVLIPIRQTIELFALRKSLDKLTDEHLNYLSERIEAMKLGGEQNDLMKVVDNDLLFHENLVRNSNLANLINIWSSIVSRIRIHFIYQDQTYEELATVWKQHQILLEAIKSRDPVLASAELNRHIYDANMSVLGK